MRFIGELRRDFLHRALDQRDLIEPAASRARGLKRAALKPSQEPMGDHGMTAGGLFDIGCRGAGIVPGSGVVLTRRLRKRLLKNGVFATSPKRLFVGAGRAVRFEFGATTELTRMRLNRSGLRRLQIHCV
jgi:hypothetical protein